MTITIVVEDGSGVTGANSLASVATADQYHEERGNTAWAAATDSAKKIGLIRMTQYLNGLPWEGYKSNSDNPLEQPRSGMVDANGYAIDSDEIATQIVHACCEGALLELTPGTLTKKRTLGVKRKKIDSLDTEYGPGGEYTEYPALLSLLAPFLKSTTSVELVRC